MNNRDMKQIFRKILNSLGVGLDAIHRSLSESRRDPNIIDAPQPPAVYKEMPTKKIVGILMAAAGYGLCSIFGFYTMMLLLGAALVGELGLGIGFALACMIPIAGCGVLAWKGTTMVTGFNRFQIYKKTIGDEELCNIKQLAGPVRKSERFVVKDVEKMIKNGWFCQGHLDKNKTCLMVTDHMYREYQKLEEEKERLRIEEETRRRQTQAKEEAAKQRKAAEEAEAQKKSGLSPEVRRVLEQGDFYVRKIRQCNETIPGEEISEKIERMEVLVDKIFDRVEQKPACASDVRKLTEYYLPTTVKLLETYAEMDAQPVGGANIQAAKREIETTLDTINKAFEKLLDSLFQETAWDVSSDISVLQTMLAQEGLTEDGLKNK